MEELDNKQPCCLVTGGAGFVGTHTLVQLLDQNVRVCVVDRIPKLLKGKVQLPGLFLYFPCFFHLTKVVRVDRRPGRSRRLRCHGNFKDVARLLKRRRKSMDRDVEELLFKIAFHAFLIAVVGSCVTRFRIRDERIQWISFLSPFTGGGNNKPASLQRVEELTGKEVAFFNVDIGDKGALEKIFDQV